MTAVYLFFTDTALAISPARRSDLAEKPCYKSCEKVGSRDQTRESFEDRSTRRLTISLSICEDTCALGGLNILRFVVLVTILHILFLCWLLVIETPTWTEDLGASTHGESLLHVSLAFARSQTTFRGS